MLSPKLAWLFFHELETEHLTNGGEECPKSGDEIPHWVCRLKVPRRWEDGIWSPREIGSGDTEEEACADLAVRRGINLWNEIHP